MSEGTTVLCQCIKSYGVDDLGDNLHHTFASTGYCPSGTTRPRYGAAGSFDGRPWPWANMDDFCTEDDPDTVDDLPIWARRALLFGMLAIVVIVIMCLAHLGDKVCETAFCERFKALINRRGYKSVPIVQSEKGLFQSKTLPV